MIFTPKNQLTIRKANISDAICIGALGIQVFLDTYATDGVRPALAREALASFSTNAIEALMNSTPTQRLFLLAERNAHIIGFVQLQFNHDHPLLPAQTKTRVNAEVQRLYVQPIHAGVGVGQQLLAAAEALTVELGGGAVWLTAWAGNTRALSFYPKRGYDDIGTTQYEFEGESYENRLFYKPLASI